MSKPYTYILFSFLKNGSGRVFTCIPRLQPRRLQPFRFQDGRTPDASPVYPVLDSSAERGDLAVYIALIMLTLMITSALFFSIILGRQVRLTEDIVESERAFYAAHSGLEHGLYELSKLESESLSLDGAVPYESQAAVYSGEARYIQQETPATLIRCVSTLGRYPESRLSARERRLTFGPAECFP